MRAIDRIAVLAETLDVKGDRLTLDTAVDSL